VRIADRVLSNANDQIPAWESPLAPVYQGRL
jgi:hypothetical protein